MKKMYLLIATLFLLYALETSISVKAAVYNLEVQKAQENLMKLGYDPGPIDGKMGPQTETAIKRFQKDNSLKITGTLNEETLQKLGINSLISLQDNNRKQPEIYENGEYSLVPVLEGGVMSSIESFSCSDPKGYLPNFIKTKEGNTVELNPEGIIITREDGTVIKAIPVPDLAIALTHGILRRNDNGNIAVIAIAKSNVIWLSNLETWIPSNLQLTDHGDKIDILSAYPESENVVYGVVRKYVNVYNKGLYVIKADFRQGSSNTILLFNSERRNIGASLNIYVQGNDVIVTCREGPPGWWLGGRSKHVHFTIPKKDIEQSSDISMLFQVPQEWLEEEIRESTVRFTVGTGVGSLFWIANSNIERDNVLYADVDYKISHSPAFSAQVEGDFGRIHLALTYLQNTAVKNNLISYL